MKPLLLASCLFFAVASAQAPRPDEFDAASIKPNASGQPVEGVMGFVPRGRFSAKNVTAKALIEIAYRMPDLAQFLTSFTDRVVLDKTGIAGEYDLHTTGWAPSRARQPGEDPTGAEPIDPAAPSMFTVLDEQLGLRLRAATGPAETLVIDAIAPPSDNFDTQAAPAFDVTSVKQNKSDETATSGLGFRPDGSLNVKNETLKRYIGLAYGGPMVLPAFLIVDGPDWIATDRFDVAARTEGSPSRDQQTAMLQSLLADRFKLTVHRETRELPLFNLVAARKDGQPGPGLKKSGIDCAAMRAQPGGMPPPDASVPVGQRPCVFQFGQGQNHAIGMTMNDLATVVLSRAVGRPVIDQTGLTGPFEWQLQWTPDQSLLAAAGSEGPDRPSIFTALQEQLGIRLEPGRGAVEVLVIDRVERPTPD